MSSDREPLLPTHVDGAKRAAKQGRYGETAKEVAKAAEGVDAGQIRRGAKQLAPSRDSIFKVAQIIGAVKAGKLPSQEQLGNWIELIINSKVLDERNVSGSTQLSEQGRKFIKDLKALLACVERVGESKNGDDKIQRFIYQTSNASVDVEGGSLDAKLPSTSELTRKGGASEAKEDALEIVGNLQHIAQLFVTSKQFRNLVADIQFLIRDLTADAAATAARKAGDVEGKVRPGEEERRQRGGNIDLNPPKGAKEARAAAEKAAEKVKTAAGDASRQIQEASKTSLQWLDENTPDDAKDEFIERIKEIVAQLQKDPDFKRALGSIKSIFGKWKEIAEDTIEKAKEEADIDGELPDVEANSSLRESVKLFEEILETFSSRPLEPVKQSFVEFFGNVKDTLGSKADEGSKETREIRRLYEDVTKFVDRALNQDGFIQSSKSNRQASALYDRAQALVNGQGKEIKKFQKDLDSCIEELTTFFEGFEEDGDLRELSERFQVLSDDLNLTGLQKALASGGTGLFTILKNDATSLFRDSVEVIVPRLLEEIREIPVPRIEFASYEADVVIDDLSLSASTVSFVPDRIRLVNKNDLTLEQKRSTFASSFDTDLYVKVEGLRVKAADVAYYLKKKTGWFGWEDYGLLDLDLGGRDGTSFTVKLENASEYDRESFFKVDKVDVDMSSFKCRLRQSKHFILNFFLMPLIRPALRRAFQSLLEEQIRSSLVSTDQSLFGLQQRAAVINSYTKAAYEAGYGAPSPSAYLKALFRTDLATAGRGAKPKTDVGLTEGVFVRGPRNEFQLTIGASYSKQLFPGRGGPLKYAEQKLREYEETEQRIREGIEDIKRAKEEALRQVREGVEGMKQETKKAGKEISAEARKANKERRLRERKERIDSGWRSEVFDLSNVD
ncbi:hypothetical protein IE53DRAFT_103062 [Violaceomyces palustris]|uniref:Uncharacterized protein n=1 Tax=Violaceomyces palustris TaxID=1673888 RepID=A0ACD0NWV9_9BASI|nr:hypothetical protein IE53DRAFT_103062 [Violaceomyces palustris]